MLTRPSSKQDRYRRRCRDGLACYRLDDLPTVELEMTLMAAGLLTGLDPDHDTTRRALRQLVLSLIADHLGDGDR